MSRGDVDIDFADRIKALDGLEYVPAAIFRDNNIVKHNTGVYFHAVPIDPVTGFCSIDYKTAEKHCCYKIDMLNVSVYEQVRDEGHLLQLMNTELNWELLQESEFCKKLFHIGNHSELVAKLKPSSISELAQVLALIRPGKKHLIQKCIDHGFDSIHDDIWTSSDSDGYALKKSHGIAYAHVIVVQANLLIEQMVDQV